MHFPSGVVLNAVAIMAGAVVGLVFHGRLSDGVRTVLFQGLGLCVVVIGVQMALKAEDGLWVP
jgi:uncharacterized membrane protein YqgA involved in biofilm formation